MFVKSINDCSEFIANDGCRIQEWLHPKNDLVELPYSVAMATVDIGQQSYKHKLEQAEIYLITSGKAVCILMMRKETSVLEMQSISNH